MDGFSLCHYFPGEFLILGGKTGKKAIYLPEQPFCYRPDQDVIDSVTPLLLAENATNNMLLSMSSVVHSFCSRVAECSEHETIIPAVLFLEERLNQTVLERTEIDKVSILVHHAIVFVWIHQFEIYLFRLSYFSNRWEMLACSRNPSNSLYGTSSLM